MAARRTGGKAPGQVRQSQMLGANGPGAMVDLPKHAVIIGGLETWTNRSEQIHEERLQEKVARALHLPRVELWAPPAAEHDTDQRKTGVKAWRFPEWFVANLPSGDGDVDAAGVRSRPLIHAKNLRDGRYFGADKKKHAVQPVRFVQACPNGHISDIQWLHFVHGAAAAKGAPPCVSPELWLDERGTSGDFVDLTVRCSRCGASKSMIRARPNDEDAVPLGFCQGDRPWLGPAAREGCEGKNGTPWPNRLLIRTASNAYFSQILSVIHIPDRDQALRAAVDVVWTDFLENAPSLDVLKMLLLMPKVKAAIGDLPLARVWQEMQRRKGGATSTLDRPIKEIELETLLDVPPALGEDVPANRDFYARSLPVTSKSGAMKKIDKVVLVHRLREVRALLGFTRFDPVTADIDGELDVGALRAPLARETSWVPAAQVHGEGFFLSFDKAAVDAWAQRVERRHRQLNAGFLAWQVTRDPGKTQRFPGVRYVMLHSLSHLLITAVALECGYSASAISERIYVGEKGCGVLLYTGSAHSEGTLGGLVEVGRHVADHLSRALELGRLCSNDPVCAQHRPDDRYEERFLHGAACHGCVLIAETCCERQNNHLDRSLVVPTIEDGPGQHSAFFGEDP